MIRKLLYRFLVSMSLFFINRLFDMVDKNNNGEISRDEIIAFATNVRAKANSIRNKA